MNASAQQELQSLRTAALNAKPADSVVQWQSSFGLVVIETRGDQVFVNGDFVQPANPGPAKDIE